MRSPLYSLYQAEIRLDDTLFKNPEVLSRSMMAMVGAFQKYPPRAPRANYFGGGRPPAAMGRSKSVTFNGLTYN